MSSAYPSDKMTNLASFMGGTLLHREFEESGLGKMLPLTISRYPLSNTAAPSASARANLHSCRQRSPPGRRHPGTSLLLGQYAYLLQEGEHVEVEPALLELAAVEAQHPT
jgi:hypothetical protein